MSLIIVETLSETPLTPEEPTATDLRVLHCLTERNATWRYSLLESDRRRMICTFTAPDAESVRESYRRGGGVFNRLWSAEIIQPEGIQPLRNEAILTIAEGTYPEGFDQAQFLSCCAESGVEWLYCYISLDRTRVICQLNASDPEVILEAHRKFNIPFERVWSAMVIKPS